MYASDVLNSVRFLLKDSEKTEYSDIQLLSALNIVLSDLWGMLLQERSPLLEETATVTMTDGVGSLPVDFHGIVDVEGHVELKAGEVMETGLYRITGVNTIKATADELNITYIATRRPLSDPESYIPLPDSFFSILVKATLAVIAGKLADAIGLLDQSRQYWAGRGVANLSETSAYV
jgi:hypothetical protein